MQKKTSMEGGTEFYEDTQDSWVDEEEVKVWKGFYKGFHITVYPCNMIIKDEEGWEYELYNPERQIEWDSWIETYSGRHGNSAEQVKAWAIRTIDEWDD